MLTNSFQPQGLRITVSSPGHALLPAFPMVPSLPSDLAVITSEGSSSMLNPKETPVNHLPNYPVKNVLKQLTSECFLIYLPIFCLSSRYQECGLFALTSQPQPLAYCLAHSSTQEMLHKQWLPWRETAHHVANRTRKLSGLKRMGWGTNSKNVSLIVSLRECHQLFKRRKHFWTIDPEYRVWICPAAFKS